MLNEKIIITGGAGLVGQNLVKLLLNYYTTIVVIDKHKKNLDILKSLNPSITAICDDLSFDGEWHNFLMDAHAVIILHAQIGGISYKSFFNNNIVATNNVIKYIKYYNINYVIHVSSSVINSNKNDFYRETKLQQEKIILGVNIPYTILRPTLMFGLFDRKHLGWLSRFMNKSPFFPIPGSGRFIRQPLYVDDFCRIILKCLKSNYDNEINNKYLNKTFNITGMENIYYIDIIKSIKKITKSRCYLLYINYNIFYTILYIWAIFDKSPPFTTQQLESLVAGDEFEISDWTSIFEVKGTPFSEAIFQTFCNSEYSDIKLDF